MFDPMYVPDPFFEFVGVVLPVLAFVGLGIGFYWIHRIIKDIEDN